ncbi:hypothetical protein Tco_0311326, partial [Tanacetum coccineum]
PPREEVERLLALITPPPSPLTPLSSPLSQIPSPPLLIPSPPPNSPTHIEIPKSCLPLQKRVRFASPTPSHEVGESSAAGASRQDGPAVVISTDQLKIIRKQSKTGKHGHGNQKSSKRSQIFKAEAKKVKPQSNPVKVSQR